MTLNSLVAYGKAFQLKLLGALLTDKAFLLRVRDLLKDTYFDADSHKWIIQQILNYFDKYHTVVTLEVLKIELQKVENEVLQVAIREELRNSYIASEEDLQYVEEEFTTFCQNQEMKGAILLSAEKLKEGDFEGIRTLVDKALKAGIDKRIGHEYKKDTETRYRADYRPTIPSPWEQLNNNIGGGWGPGDLIIIFGSPGAGKSWCMVSIAGKAVELGYNVNYYTLELGEDYVGKRFDCFFTKIPITNLAEHRTEVEKVVANLPGNLVIKEYPPKGVTVNTIKSHVQKCADMGHKPDLIIVDYADYLRPPARSRYTERKDEVDDVYISLKGLAKELQIPVVTPSQVNRAGAKDDIIEGDKAAGSYDKMMVADISMSLSRKKEDKVLGTGRFHMMKNRYGHDGNTYNVKVDTETGHIEFEGEAEMVTDQNSSRKVNPSLLANFFGSRGG